MKGIGINTSNNLEDEVNPRTKEGRAAVTKMLMCIFELWELSSQDQLALLGLSQRSRASLVRYRKGEPIADRRGLINRAEILLSIHKSLRTLFPKNKDIAYKWISVPNRSFDGQKPLDVIKEKGVPGLLTVKQYLDLALS